MKLSVIKFGEHLNPPISRQRVNFLVQNGNLVRENKKIDTDHPTNAAWINNYSQSNHREKAVGRTKAIRENIERQRQAAGELEEIDNFDVEGVLEHLATLDIRKLPKSDIDKMKALEGALKVRVERQYKRQELIDRSLVTTVFGKLYQIDTNHLRVLGATLAPEIAGLLGAEEPDKVLEVEKIIDDRIIKVLAHIKRIINDSLVSWGTEGLVE